MRLLAENDYVWGPALKSLVLHPREADEMVVRLLALAESGGLQNLATLEIFDYQPGLTQGAALLWLLWLKREAKKALQGKGQAALWDVKGLYLEHLPTSMQQIAETQLVQLSEARTQIRKARAGARVV